MASPSAGAPALKYGDVNTETTSPGEVKGLTKKFKIKWFILILKHIYFEIKKKLIPILIIIIIPFIEQIYYNII